MKITSFTPVIMSVKSDDIVALFEEMGFMRKHLTKFEELDSYCVNMDYNDSFRVDVSQVKTLPHENRDLMSIRINVDDFDEAYKFFTAHGFKTPMGDEGINTNSSKGVLMLSPSGFLVNIVKHIK